MHAYDWSADPAQVSAAFRFPPLVSWDSPAAIRQCSVARLKSWGWALYVWTYGDTERGVSESAAREGQRMAKKERNRSKAIS
eukprot:scaffold309_cov235-Pinguiococcus_pyrenoidosus.AAC.5